MSIPLTDSAFDIGRDLQNAYDEGYRQGRYDEKVEEERKAGRWIPCSERLPEIGQSVLLSVGGMYSAEGCLREDGDWAQFRWDAIQRKDMVGAWKPLPEPYKGEQE